MSDYLVELGANASARRIVKALGLPLPMPQKLERGEGAWEERPLEGRTVLVVPSAAEAVTKVLAETLARAGATPLVDGATGPGTPWAAAGEAWGRPAHTVEGTGPERGLHALVLDATSYASTEDLKGLFAALAPRIQALATCGRVVVLGRPADTAKTIAEAAAQHALEGFVRALAREVGGKGITANLLTVRRGAEKALAGPLRWLLSARSAFFTSQPLAVGDGKKAPDALPWSRSLDGKVAVVTGAARGIGAATVAALAREGAKVLCLDRPADAELLAEVARDVGGVPVLADVTEADAADALRAAAPGGRIDVLVHNAGITRDKTFARMDASWWDLTMAVNLQALIDLTDRLDDALADGGRVIALSSVSGIAGNFGQTNYSASKSGVIGFVEASARALGKRGVTVNGIAPGFIETRLTAAIPAATREAGRRMSCLVQGGLPIDIAEAVTFLATPGAWGVHGQILRVCGGAFIGA